MFYDYHTLYGQTKNSVSIPSNRKFFEPVQESSFYVSLPKPSCEDSYAYRTRLHTPEEDKQIPLDTYSKSPLDTYSKSPSAWGPHLWYYLHTCSFNYPDHPSQEKKENMKKWLRSLYATMPCSSCSQHYKSYMDDADLDTICSSKEALFTFIVDLHNKVNARTGKKQLSYQEAYDMYSRGQH